MEKSDLYVVFIYLQLVQVGQRKLLINNKRTITANGFKVELPLTKE